MENSAQTPDKSCYKHTYFPKYRIYYPRKIKEVRALLVCFLRVLIIYPIVIFGIRLMGKRQIGELQPTELVVSMLISNAATLPLENQELPLFMGIIPMLMLICFEVLLSWGTLRHRGFRRLLLGSPQVIIRGGVLDQKLMRALRLSLDDVLTALRAQGIFDVNEVQLAVVETNGTISVYQKAPQRPLTCADMKLHPKDEPPPEVLISDGCVSAHGLRAAKFTEARLEGILRQQGLRAADIFLMTADANGLHTLILKEKAGAAS